MPPETLGPYRLDSLLGKGGMGEVHRAIDRRSGRAVALKVLPSELARDPDRVARFRREQSALAAFEHPHIVRPLSPVEQFGDVWCFAMELVPSVDLAALLRRRGRLPAPEAANVALQTLSALAAAHAGGIIHRDVKPSNLLIDAEGRVHVTDFGLARAGDATRLTVTGQMLGTPEYMSPEQAEGRDPDARSDLYAVGCVLYECLAGQPPFRTPNPLATLRQHAVAAAPPIADLPEPLRVALERALAKDPAARFPAAEAMAAALRAAVPEAESAVLAIEPSMVASAGGQTVYDPPRRRIRAWLWIVLLLLAAGGTWAALRSPSGPAQRVVTVEVEGVAYRGDLVEIRDGQLRLREPGGIVRTWPMSAIERISYEPVADGKR